MAWPYSGTWAGKSAGNNELGTILAALIRGINERREAVGSATQTWTTNTTAKAYPAASDFTGWAIHGSEINSMMSSIQTRIATLYGLVTWYETSAFTTAISSFADLLNLGDYGSSYVARNTFALDWYYQIKQALEHLRYFKIRSSIPVGCAAWSGHYSNDGYSTRQDAWDARNDNTTISSPTYTIMWTMEAGYQCKLWTSITKEFDITNYAGTAIKGEMTVTKLAIRNTSGISVDVHGGTVSVSAAGSETVTMTDAITPGSTQSITASITTTEPSTMPFLDEDGSKQIGLVLDDIDIYIDLASATTDLT